MADYDVFDDAELELNAMDTEEVRPEPVGPPTRNLGELSLEELEQELRRRRARHEQPGQHAEVAAGGSGIAGGNGAVGGGGVAGGSGGVGQPTAPGGTTGGVLTPGSGQVARSGPGGTANHPAPGGPGATGGSGPGSSGGGSQAGEGQAAAAAAAGAGGPGPGANQPGENQVSGFRAVMPNPNVWRMDDVEKGRNVKMFLREVTRWAAVARVPMIDALQLHVADPLKEALFAIAEQAKAERRLMTEEDMEKMFLDLVGADTIQVQHTAMKRLINRECVQGDQSVAQYSVAFRLLAQQVQAFPAGALCEMYVQGLQADLRHAAVKIQLPHQWRVHNVFHVSLVKPYVGDAVPNLVAPPPDRWEDGQPVYEVEKLVDHRLTSGYRPQLEFLVKWVGYPSEGNTWEPLDNLQGSMDLGHQSAVLSNYRTLLRLLALLPDPTKRSSALLEARSTLRARQRESNPELIFQHSKELVAKIGYLRVITPRRHDDATAAPKTYVLRNGELVEGQGEGRGDRVVGAEVLSKGEALQRNASHFKRLYGADKPKNMFF
ncbi:hypothetical protein QJQ45_009910 [Haematococcus lacustris]|nr:hypothetical protein QJQ45_009910 [Haematococcus lacustris]